jgi:hypothetical protein
MQNKWAFRLEAHFWHQCSSVLCMQDVPATSYDQIREAALLPSKLFFFPFKFLPFFSKLFFHKNQNFIYFIFILHPLLMLCPAL